MRVVVDIRCLLVYRLLLIGLCIRPALSHGIHYTAVVNCSIW